MIFRATQGNRPGHSEERARILDLHRARCRRVPLLALAKVRAKSERQARRLLAEALDGLDFAKEVGAVKITEASADPDAEHKLVDLDGSQLD